jgi:hypothetical protein
VAGARDGNGNLRAHNHNVIADMNRPDAPSHKPTFAGLFSLTSIAGYTMSGIGGVAIG